MIYAAIIWRSRNYNPAVKFPQKEIDTPRRRQTLCTPRPWISRPTSHRAITLSVCLPASGRLYPDGFAVFAIGFVIGICEFALAIGEPSPSSLWNVLACMFIPSSSSLSRPPAAAAAAATTTQANVKLDLDIESRVHSTRLNLTSVQRAPFSSHLSSFVRVTVN